MDHCANRHIFLLLGQAEDPCSHITSHILLRTGRLRFLQRRNNNYTKMLAMIRVTLGQGQVRRRRQKRLGNYSGHPPLIPHETLVPDGPHVTVVPETSHEACSPAVKLSETKCGIDQRVDPKSNVPSLVN